MIWKFLHVSSWSVEPQKCPYCCCLLEEKAGENFQWSACNGVLGYYRGRVLIEGANLLPPWATGSAHPHDLQSCERRVKKLHSREREVVVGE